GGSQGRPPRTRSRQAGFPRCSTQCSLRRAAARDQTGDLEQRRRGNEDEPSDGLSEYGSERLNGERKVRRDGGNDERQQDDLRAEAAGTRADFLLEALLGRHTV